MARGSGYCAPYRRRRQGKTDYRTRKTLVLSGRPRIVIRGSLRNVMAQFIVAKPSGDMVLASAHSRELVDKYGWKAARGNLPAAYLTGLLCGLKAKTKGVENAILDMGLHSPTKGARIFSAVKGVLDAGVDVPHGEEKLPDEDRFKGAHIAEYAKGLVSSPEAYKLRFSKYMERGISPENLYENFVEVEKNIRTAFESGGKAD